MPKHRWILAALVLSSATLSATDYLTEGYDNARTGWVKDEKIFTTSNVQNMKLLWKVKLPSTTREMHNMFPPLIVERVTMPQGTREMAVVAGVTDDLFGIDVATGETMWRTHFDSTYTPAPGGRGSTLCPGGQTAVPVIAPTSTPGKYTIYAVSWDGRLRQVNLADGKDAAPPEKFMPPNGKPYALNLHNGVIYTASAQGCGGVANAFYSFDLATKKAAVFSPAGGGMWGRRGVAIDGDGVVYFTTGDATFNPTTRSLGNGLVSVKMDANKQMQLVDYFAPKNANWMFRRDLDINVTPIPLDFQGKKLLVGTSKECRMWLLDRTGMGGEDHRTPLATSPLLCNDQTAYDEQGVWGAMAAWQDGSTQWLYVPFWGPVSKQFKAPIEHARPTGGGVGAYKIEQRAGKWQFTPAWLSRNMDLAENVLIANGVAFVSDSGEDASQTMPDSAWDAPGGGRMGGSLSSGSARRIPGSRHATLYALDARTGKELWSSGNQMTSWSHFSGLTVANGRAYMPTFDGTLYAFGVR
jgi:outer membrane protein assembly factor BamB